MLISNIVEHKYSILQCAVNHEWGHTHTRTDCQWMDGWHVTNRWTLTQKEVVILASGLVELLLSLHEHRHELVYLCVCVWLPFVCQAALFNWFILKSSRRFPVKLVPYSGTMNDWKIISQGRIHEVIYLCIIVCILRKGIQRVKLFSCVEFPPPLFLVFNSYSICCSRIPYTQNCPFGLGH